MLSWRGFDHLGSLSLSSYFSEKNKRRVAYSLNCGVIGFLTHILLYDNLLHIVIEVVYWVIKTINRKNCYDVGGGVYLCIRNEEQSSIEYNF